MPADGGGAAGGAVRNRLVARATPDSASASCKKLGEKAASSRRLSRVMWAVRLKSSRRQTSSKPASRARRSSQAWSRGVTSSARST